MTQWHSHPPTTNLQQGEVQIWLASLIPHKPRLKEYESLLNESELSRTKRFKFTEHQERFALAHGILRTLLGALIDSDPKAISFDYNLHGKPALKGKHKIQFNISHTGDYAVFAFTHDKPLGIDIETIAKRPIEKLAERFFSKDEVKALLALPKEERTHAFFYMWTQKEAYIKAIGLGLSQPLDEFSVSAIPPSNIISIDNSREKAMSWAMHPFDIDETVIGHLGVEDKSLHVEFNSFL